MKRLYFISALSAFMLTGCSALKSNSATVNAPVQNTDVKVEQVKIDNNMNVTAPEVNAQVPEASKPAKVRHRSRLYGRLSGEWTIIKAGKTDIPYEDEMPYLIFNEKQWVFYASNGCNVLNGNFVYEGDNSIKFGTVLSTMRFCPDVTYESEINSVLKDGNIVEAKLEQHGRETYLLLLNDRSQTVMKLRRHNLDFLNGQWDVSRIGDDQIDKEEGVNIFFDVPECKVHGNTGCNFFNGIIEVDPYRTSSISLKNMGVTRRACPDLDTETKFLVALEQVAQVKNSGNDTVYLLDKQGKTIITLHRAK